MRAGEDQLPAVSSASGLYDSLYAAHDEFNLQCFGNRLPVPVITLQRNRGSYGHFSAQQFGLRTGNETGDEIALNPVYFGSRPLTSCLGTLVHEMSHQYQLYYGVPGRRGYHNREWAKIMKSVGLQSTPTGDPSGKPTGDRVTQIVIPGGLFEQTAALLVNSGFALDWYDRAQVLRAEQETSEKSKASRSGKRVKYSCPICGSNMWASHGAQFDCHIHKVLALPQE